MFKLKVPKMMKETHIIPCLVALLQGGITAEEAAVLVEKGVVRTGKLFQKTADEGTVVRPGATITVQTEEILEDYLVDAPQHPVFEDESFFVWNKPTGLLQAATRSKSKAPTLYDSIVDYMQQLGEYDIDSLRVPYLCHRLDKEIGGLCIVAKNQWMFENMLSALREQRVKRFFYVVVAGEPAVKDQLTGFIGKSVTGEVQILSRPIKGARSCAMRYRCMKRDAEAGVALLEVEMITDRPGQIYAQLATSGLPVLGDEKYGNKKANKKYGVENPAIWASRIVFQTGRANPLEYINGLEISTDEIYLPPTEVTP